jgi:hypothetical protein
MKEIYIKNLTLGQKINLYCWIANKRQIKNNLFVDVYDSTGQLECYASAQITQNYDELCKLNRESCVSLFGELVQTDKKQEFQILSFEVFSKSTLTISPYPNEANFNVIDEKHAMQVIEHPTFYIRNRDLSMLFYIKAVFKRQLQNYLWNKGFVEFESPTLTRQTLYEDKGAIWLERDGQHLSLSRCATFHLEPALVSYEKLFTIISVLLMFSILIPSVFAHRGGTDSNGGHYDRTSGDYHYHHGYPAHEHTDGVCPYDFHNTEDTNDYGGNKSFIESNTQETSYNYKEQNSTIRKKSF